MLETRNIYEYRVGGIKISHNERLGIAGGTEIALLFSMMNWTRWLGKTTENQAARYLKKCGFRIQHRNYETPLGEIDIVAKYGNMIVFVEVKSLAFREPFHPMDHFNYWKKKKQIRLGQLYLSRLRKEVQARFDLVTVIKKDGDFFIEHYENVIDEASL